MEKRYEFLPHTADAKFRAYGRNLEEALANTALAMVSLMWDYESIELKEKETVEIRATSLESLVVKFLTELLYLLEVKGFLLGRVEELEIKEPASKSKETEVGESGLGSPAEKYSLRAVLAGDHISDRYEIFGEVKAATYNDFRLEHREDGVVLQVVVDM